jgi:hypothetical protein
MLSQHHRSQVFPFFGLVELIHAIISHELANPFGQRFIAWHPPESSQRAPPIYAHPFIYIFFAMSHFLFHKRTWLAKSEPQDREGRSSEATGGKTSPQYLVSPSCRNNNLLRKKGEQPRYKVNEYASNPNVYCDCCSYNQYCSDYAADIRTA